MQQIPVAENTSVAVTVSGHGQPVVFLNGFGGYQEIWTAQVAAFTAAGFQTVTWDYRGQGTSTGDTAASLRVLAGDLHTVLNTLDLQTPILIGHSMGASVIWAFLKDYPAFAVKAVVTVDQSPMMVNTQNWWYGFRGLDRASTHQFFQLLSRHHETLKGLAAAVAEPLLAAEKAHPFFRIAAEELLSNHLRADWRPVVEKMTCPTLMVSALQSPYFPTGYGDWAARWNTHIQTATIDGCGHDIMAEVPDRFDTAVLAFLQALPQA